MMNLNYKLNRVLILCTVWVLTASLGGCKLDEIVADESKKDLTGTWHIKKATRNGTDITEKFDFSDFHIQFREDGTFQIHHPVPFIVKKNGSYRLDDPQYPFRISFLEDGDDVPVLSDFEYPIVAGQRALTLSFQVGCVHNTYRYTVVKTNE